MGNCFKTLKPAAVVPVSTPVVMPEETLYDALFANKNMKQIAQLIDQNLVYRSDGIRLIDLYKPGTYAESLFALLYQQNLALLSRLLKGGICDYNIENVLPKFDNPNYETIIMIIMAYSYKFDIDSLSPAGIKVVGKIEQIAINNDATIVKPGIADLATAAQMMLKRCLSCFCYVSELFDGECILCGICSAPGCLNDKQKNSEKCSDCRL